MTRIKYALLAAVVLFGVNCLKADEYETAIAIQLSLDQVKPKQPDASKANKVQRIDVSVLLAPFACGPCEQFKKDIKTYSGPYKFIVGVGDESGSYPHYSWPGGSQTGWSGMAAFDKAVKLSQQPTVKVQVKAYTPVWTWPGNLSQHLAQEHGQNISGLSNDQMERLHDSLHESQHRRRKRR